MTKYANIQFITSVTNYVDPISPTFLSRKKGRAYLTELLILRIYEIEKRIFYKDFLFSAIISWYNISKLAIHLINTQILG